MHEFHLMKNLLRTVEAVAREHDARRVVSVQVWMGALSHITPDHFREHFEQDSVGTLVEGAHLMLEASEDLDDPRAQDILLKSVELS